ncbi:MAG TPA: hypothetical protein DEP84_26090, partial [Chloroflexi bacterium]|nr:hypothetical protein [Chloroflexota bacterium]
VALLATLAACAGQGAALQTPAAAVPAIQGTVESAAPAAEATAGAALTALAGTPTVGATGGLTETGVMTGTAVAGGNVVTVTLTSFHIDMPMTLPAGSTTFEVTNAANIEHNFEIEGQGLEKVFDSNLQPGETRKMQVDLQPGTYEVYCPVDNHAEQGMKLELTVTQ